MAHLKTLVAVMAVVLLQSCGTKQATETLWVAGYKVNCGEETQGECLLVSKDDALDKAQWTLFRQGIEGFQFEEGVLKKVEVEALTKEAQGEAADASAVAYKLVQVKESQPDPRIALAASWQLKTFKGSAVLDKVIKPTLQVDLKEMRVYGNAGCNDYFGGVSQLGTQQITFKAMASTKMLCTGETIETDYLMALPHAAIYKVEGEELRFFDKAGKELFAFVKNDGKPNQQLNGKWVVSHIKGQAINKKDSQPRVELNLNEKRISGNDSCNNFSGSIEKVSDKELAFGKDIAVTQMLCPDKMKVADAFEQALTEVAHYKISGTDMMLYNAAGEELLALQKVE